MRFWFLLHKWTGIAVTALALVLCLTGLPLIFHDEIDGWLDPPVPPRALPAGTPEMPIDDLLALALGASPGDVIRWVTPGEGEPVLHVGLGPTPEPGPDGRYLRLDTRTGEVLATPGGKADGPLEQAMDVIHDLHTELLLDTPGEIVLAVIGVVFVVATVSGAVLYAPFMRRRQFGEVRAGRSRRTLWLDLHNLAGIVTLAWVVVIGVTGAFNALSQIMLARWAGTDVRAQTAAYRMRDAAPVTGAALRDVIATVEHAVPATRVRLVVYPNRRWVSPHHFLVWTWGATPLTARLRTAVLVDAVTGAVTSAAPLPWYLQVLDVARPLHFGDYGGLPLKILWALLDIATIAVLGSGLYLWLARRG